MATIETPGLKASRQIASLRYLPDGWRNGEGVAFDVDYLNWLSEAFRQMYPVQAPEPIICPTTYGFVSAEWSFPDAEISLEIALESRQGDLLWANTNTRKSGEVSIDMTGPEGWTSLAEYLTQFAGEQE